MEFLSPQVVSVAKLPILNPNEFNLWKMRIEQYFLMNDYSLWEAILNGDSFIPTRVIKGVVQPVAPTTVEQRLARKNELKARGTLLMALPDKHQLKFNIHKDAKTLMEAIKKRFGGNKETKKVQKTLLKQQYKNFTGSSSDSLDQIHDRLQKLISQLEILGESLSQEDINLNTNEPVSVVASVSAASANIPVSALPNVDTLNLKQIDADDLEEMDLKWKMAMLTVRARRFLQRTGRNLGANGPTSMGFDMSKVEWYNCHRKGHFARECGPPKDTRRNVSTKPQRRNIPVETSTSNALVSQCDGVGSYDWSFQAEEVPTNYALIVLIVLTMRYQSREGYYAVPPPYTGTFMPPKPNLVFHDAPNVHETAHTAFNVELSPTKPDKDLSHTHMPSAPIIEDWVFDSEDKSEAEPSQNAPSFVQTTEQVKTPRPYVKPVEHSILAANHKTDIPKPKSLGNNINRKACFVSVLTKSKLVPLTAARTVTTAVPQPHVTRPRPAKIVVTKPYSPPRRNINRRPSPKPSNFPPKVTIVKAPMGNPHHALKDKGVIDSGCSRNMTRNMSYLSDFEAINGGYVAFGGNPKGGNITGKGKIRTGKLDFDDVYFVKELKFNIFSVSQMCDKKNSVIFTDTECIVLSPEFKLPDENQVLLRVPRKNNMYNVDLKNIVPSGDLTCLFTKETLDESNLWHRRLGYINFKTMNKLVKGNLVRGLPLKVFKNNHACVACIKDKQHKAFCKTKPGEFSVPRTPQQNEIAERKNRTLIKAARTMLADSLLPIPFWVEAVNTTCYVQNRVSVTKPHNKAPYELLLGRTPSIGFMRPFGCPVTILNTLDPLGSGPTWLFDIDTLTKSMNYQPVTVGNQSNPTAGVQEQFDTEKAGEDNVQQNEPEFEVEKPETEVHVSPSSSAQTKNHDDKTKREAKCKSHVEFSIGYRNLSAEFEDFSDNSINEVNAAGTLVSTVGQISTNSTNTFSAAGLSNTAVSPTLKKSSYVDTSQCPDDPNMPALEDITYSDDEEDVGAEADFTNLETNIIVSPIPTTKVHKVHHVTQIIGDLSSATQTRSMTRVAKDQGGLTQINNEDFHTCMFACFLSQEVPKRVHQALKDPSWIKAMQEELLQFKMQKVWVLVDFSNRERAIGHTQEEGIDYEEVYAPVARIEAIRLFLAYASFMGFMVYQIDVKSAFLYGNIEEEVYVCQPPGFKDHDILTREWFSTGKDRSDLVHQEEKSKAKARWDFISQDKYVAEILKKFGLKDGKSASTHIDAENPLIKDSDGEDVDMHTYRSMIRSLMYLTSSRPDIMFAVYACAHF
nr:ribonuclease H-like domain-containing protein [Tanacetum cinerariifolium]